MFDSGENREENYLLVTLRGQKVDMLLLMFLFHFSFHRLVDFLTLQTCILTAWCYLGGN